MNVIEEAARYALLGAAVCFAVGLHLMKSPATARRGNLLSAWAMAGAVAATLTVIVARGTVTGTGWIVLATGAALGAFTGLRLARRVRMTAVPQLVSLFNAVGGGAAVLLAIGHLLDGDAGVRAALPGGLDIVIGAVTFSGSLIASGKLQGIVPSRPLVFKGARAVTLLCAGSAVAGVLWLSAAPADPAPLLLALGAGLAFGVAVVLPIGGADMPVVISLLNACTGIAVAMAGFVLDEQTLVIAGALVGASGAILTKLMADAMNRSIMSIILGGFGTGDEPVLAGPAGPVRSVTAEDVAIQLAYASRVIVVPGYGLAAARGQQELAQLTRLLEERGVAVDFAIHPVAGRMPGHMNVLLAEVDVPYPRMKELEEANAVLQQADVALVVGANDVTNPAARRPGNALSGMPILDVDAARQIVVVKRSMGHGYAGMDNELFADPKTGMLFADARTALAAIAAAVRTFSGPKR
ncbi:NAD(P)(+) transhydrogenase (Re/Si-specific) subunit beta [Glycomyces harbinensis]|uniref:NAD(P) transhydrogenase subunit beta n=1 Tax=Glycomyces harbinensis TaxID=58114 RepID=A0A1G6XPD4_9ACTN|nr:NAD(P)(+) transhydrogenase (Re/Si-specific) subunit beta [Glycomyces harbinensis]SDD79156.1 NAD(P) transhydrogenase subunit beta [Glycomyces harbinensis]